MQKINLLKWYVLVSSLIMMSSCSTLNVESRSLRKYRNVLILGNSITHHKPAPTMGWYGDWGMAASARDSDFVHRLMVKFKTIAPNAKVKFQNIAVFERTFWTYDLSQLDSLKNLKPELIILRLGENVDGKTLTEHGFTKHYEALAAYLTSNNPNAKIIHASSFWKINNVAQMIKSVADQRGDAYISLSNLAQDPSNMALKEYENKGVAMHPSNKGMAAIAEAIWTEILKL